MFLLTNVKKLADALQMRVILPYIMFLAEETLHLMEYLKLLERENLFYRMSAPLIQENVQIRLEEILEHCLVFPKMQ